MNASYEHPSLRTPVTQEQRDRAAEHLQAAYAEGRISEEEFDRRIGQVLAANTRKDLNEAFFGLVDVPVPPSGPTYGPSYNTSSSYRSYGPSTSAGMSPYDSHYPVPQQGTAGGALAHFSGLFTSIIGPGIGYAVSSPGSLARKESAKAFNFQLIALIAVVIGGILQGITHHNGMIDFIVGLGWIAWVVLSIIGGVKAAKGQDWTNPVKKVVKLNVLSEK
jgi:uncharacterized Tic20 family protein